MSNFVAMKRYPISEDEILTVNESAFAYNYIEKARMGVPFRFLTDIAEKLSLSMLEISNLLHVSLRTLQRYAPTKKLDTDASAKALQLASLLAKGTEVLGSENTFNDWLNSSIPALNGKKPKEFLDTPFGFQLLDEELDRIKFGIFA